MIMKTMSAFIAVAGCVALAEAQAVDLPAMPEADSALAMAAPSWSGALITDSYVPRLRSESELASKAGTRQGGLELVMMADPASNTRFSLDPVTPTIGLRASYDWPSWAGGTLSGFVGAGADPAFGPPASAMRQIAGTDNADIRRNRHATHAAETSSIFTLGYAWRSFTLEGSTFASQEREDRRVLDRQSFKLDSASTRLSYSPAPEWTFQFSRGSLGGLDALDPYLEVRRTTLSATYRKDFRNAQWQTTFAWGRTQRRQAEPTMGYLAESTLRFAKSDAFFGRLEQARSDELTRQNDAMRRELFTAKKITVGYYRELPPQGSTRIDVGAFASRYAVPSYAVASYGNAPTSFMVFMRARYQ
jgi:hypothetical protein